MFVVTLTGFGPGLETFEVGDSVNFVHSLLEFCASLAPPSVTVCEGGVLEFDRFDDVVDITFLFDAAEGLLLLLVLLTTLKLLLAALSASPSPIR